MLDVTIGNVRVLCAAAAKAERWLGVSLMNTVHAMRPGDLLLVGPERWELLVRGEERMQLARAIAPPSTERTPIIPPSWSADPSAFA